MSTHDIRIAFFSFLALLIPVVAFGYATAVIASRFQDEAAVEPDKKPRRLESVRWSVPDCRLTWLVSEGRKDENGEYAPETLIEHEISMDEATMTVNGETRRFSKEEAAAVHNVLDLIAKYAAESTVWWQKGEGEPVQKETKRARHGP